MIAPTYTHPGVNALMLRASKARRHAELFRRAKDSFARAGYTSSAEFCEREMRAQILVYSDCMRQLGVKQP